MPTQYTVIRVKSLDSAKRVRAYWVVGLSILLAFMILLFSIRLVLQSKTVDNHHTESSPKINPICTSKKCLRTASSFRLAMDTSVNPCDDFYQYTCGHWSEEQPNRVWYPTFSNFEIIQDKISIAVEKFLKQNDSEDDPLPVKQSRQFYQSCVNIKQQKRLKLSVMNKYLKEANLPLVPTFFKDPQGQIDFDWKKTDVDLKRLFELDLFIEFNVDADLFNTTNNAMYMGKPPPVSLLERFLNISPIIKKVLAILSPTPIDDAMIERAARYIQSTSSIVSTKINLSKSHNDIKKVLVHDIQKATNIVFRGQNLDVEDIWEPYLNIMFTGIPNVTLDLKDKDLILTTDEDLEYLHKIASVLAKTPKVYVELYAWWKAINFMMDKIPEISKSKSYSVSHMNSLECTKMTTKYMGVAVSYGIADKTLLNNTKSKVEQMLSDIKVAFDQKIKQIRWMDEANKQVTLEKNKMMMSFIGYPDQRLMEKEGVEKYYENIYIRNDTYLDNVMQFISSSFPSKLSNLRERHKADWILDPIMVNAFYSPKGNSLYVPTAILKFPMYDLGLQVLNYGSMGSILGHELIHAFDNGGSRFDQFGNYRQWWTDKTLFFFIIKAQCFIQQYDSYKIPAINIHIQGKATLGENIADNGGLNNAYLAYQNYLTRHEPEQKLPGFENFTNDQMFFLAFASFHCEEMDTALLKLQILIDPHCPSQIRVLGALQNSEEFSKAFGCPKGSKMNPIRPKCHLW